MYVMGGQLVVHITSALLCISEKHLDIFIVQTIRTLINFEIIILRKLHFIQYLYIM